MHTFSLLLDEVGRWLFSTHYFLSAFQRCVKDTARCFVIFLEVHWVFALVDLDISPSLRGFFAIDVGILRTLITKNYLSLLLKFVQFILFGDRLKIPGLDLH